MLLNKTCYNRIEFDTVKAVNWIKFASKDLEREVIILWWRRGWGLCLVLCLVHGADRWLFSHLERGLSLRLELGLFICLGRLLDTVVHLSITEDLERFDDNVG